MGAILGNSTLFTSNYFLVIIPNDVAIGKLRVKGEGGQGNICKHGIVKSRQDHSACVNIPITNNVS